MQKVVVVYHSKTKKLYKFTFNSHGEVEIFSNDPIDENMVCVGLVDSRRLDLENGFLLEEKYNGN